MNRLIEITNEEEGHELLQYLAMVPFMFMIIGIGLQLFLAGHSLVVTVNAAREGARALAVCGGTTGDAWTAVVDASPGYSPRLERANRGSKTTVRVSNEVRTLNIPYLGHLPIARIPAEAVMRTERCPSW